MAVQLEGPIARIERRTGKRVVINANEVSDSLAKCFPQYGSPLFALLPREIRDLIWAFTTAPYENPEARYADNEYYYRPGHTARLRSETNLLLTCRRIWLEANHLPMLQAEHCFWYYRAAPDGRDREWMSGLSELNRRNFGELHLFVQMFAIENIRADPGHIRLLFLPQHQRHQTSDFQPRLLHVTIRHTDWWFWENDTPLRFEDRWLQALLDSPDLRSTEALKLELETLDYKIPQLLAIVERLEKLHSRAFETHIVDGKAVTTQFVLQDKREELTWTGPVNINNSAFRPYQGKDRLNYHVITLIWKLKFLEIPGAHVPTLRIAPRTQPPGPLSSPKESSTRSSPYEHDSYLLRRLPSLEQAWFTRPLRRRERRRDVKRRKRGGWSSRMVREHGRLLDAALRVRMESVAQAELLEHERFVSFERIMRSFREKPFRALFENTLLRLED